MEPRYTSVNFGLEWICYAINYTTEWERTGDPVWRDRVMAMMKHVVSGGELGGGNFDIIFGGAEDLAMMEALVAWCRAQGCFGVDSIALPGDRHTKNFFESFGLVARAIVVHRSLP